MSMSLIHVYKRNKVCGEDYRQIILIFGMARNDLGCSNSHIKINLCGLWFARLYFKLNHLQFLIFMKFSTQICFQLSNFANKVLAPEFPEQFECKLRALTVEQNVF